MNLHWTEFLLRGPAIKKEEAISLLIRAGSPGVLEEDYPFEDDISLKAYLTQGLDTKDLRVIKRLGFKVGLKPFLDRDWLVEWKKGLRPVRVVSSKGHSIVIRPSWCAPKKRPLDIVIDIDPEMAFGTGRHATTKTCLKVLLDICLGNNVPSLLDVGTGTGILAIAAKRLGVRHVLANDIDLEAIRTARANAKKNSTVIHFTRRPIERINGRFSVITANIISGELVRLMPYLGKRLKRGGSLVLSGILKEETDEIKGSLAEAGLTCIKVSAAREKNDIWATMLIKKWR